MNPISQRSLFNSHFSMRLLCQMSLFTVAVISFCSHAAHAVSPQPLPSIADISSAMNLNIHKISNFKARWITITVTDPGLWGENVGGDIEPLIGEKRVQVERSLGLFLDGKAFVDSEALKLSSLQKLVDHRKYWLNEKRGIGYFSIETQEALDETGKVGLVNGGIPTAYEVDRPPVPFLALGRMQIASDSQPDTHLVDQGAHVVGWEEFHGLKCIRLEYKGTEGAMSYTSYALVSPDRDYKTVVSELVSQSSDPKLPFKRTVARTVVEKFTKYDDAWIPSRVHHELKRTMVDGREKSLLEKFRLVEFKADAVNTDLLFEPLLSAGTRLYRNGADAKGAKVEVVGGDVLKEVQQLQNGDFSSLDEKVEDLRSP